ncbi:MAG: ferritin-like domain-containing protein [Proteobacteria bacterium]|nr:ferritin-like domain-containing protein [Pseudomonadota bacterium]
MSRKDGNIASENDHLIGRAEVDDLEAILAVSATDASETIHAVAEHQDAIFTWEYRKGARPQLDKLYDKARTNQWNGDSDVPWDTDVDQRKVVLGNVLAYGGFMPGITDLRGTPFEKWNADEWIALGCESQNWTLSQFLHGEQGALLCTAKIVETVPWIDAKYYAATQVMDEARHVEVFSRYLDTKLSGHYPINPHLKLLLDQVVGDSRWDMTYLGMQIMVEGLALAAFRSMHDLTIEPLLRHILRYVMADESRHIAFGVVTLKELYSQLSAAELRERQEFVFEAAVRMRDRFLQQEVWERMGLPVKQTIKLIMQAPERRVFQRMLFTNVVPNCKKLGLLDAGDGWLRRKFEELGVLQFEHLDDTASAYEAFQIPRATVV